MKYYFPEKRTGARGAPTNVVNEVISFSGEEDWCSWSAYKCCK